MAGLKAAFLPRLRGRYVGPKRRPPHRPTGWGHVQEDALKHNVEAFVDIFVGNPEHPPASQFQIMFALAIML